MLFCVLPFAGFEMIVKKIATKYEQIVLTFQNKEAEEEEISNRT